MYTAGKSIITAIMFLAIIIVSSVRTTCHAADSDPDKFFDRKWTGTTYSSDGNPVGITVSTPTSGSKDKELSYSQQRFCTIRASYAGIVLTTGRKYLITTSNGGFCNSLLQGSLTLQKAGDDMLCYVDYLDGKGQKKHEQALLMPAD